LQLRDITSMRMIGLGVDSDSLTYDEVPVTDRWTYQDEEGREKVQKDGCSVSSS